MFHTFTREQILTAPEDVRKNLMTYSYMIGYDAYGSTADPAEDPSYFFNHSCDPNCWYDTDDKLVAMRRIEPGEHVVYDYAFTETEARCEVQLRHGACLRPHHVSRTLRSFHAGMVCRCGAPHCRGRLDFGEYRSPAFMAKYSVRIVRPAWRYLLTLASS